MEQTLIEKILAHLFGHKYYANIINRTGTDIDEISCFIFTTREQANAHRESLLTNRSFSFVETISFRSRKTYVNK